MSRRRRWIGAGLGLTGALVLILAVWPTNWGPRPLLVNPANGSQAVTDRHGRLLRLSLTSDDKYRLWTPLEQMPDALIQATLDYEDHWFHWHPGVNPQALLRAAWTTFVSRERPMGGSTLTMQLARLRWQLKTRHLSGKLDQIGHALWLERHFSKRDILEAYLNLAPYGANIEGAGAAAWVYFHQPLARLTPDQARALALIPQNPSARAPLTDAGRGRLRQAWRHVHGDDGGFERVEFHTRQELPLAAPHFSERVWELDSRQPVLATSLDLNLQRLAEDLVRAYLRPYQSQGVTNASLLVARASSMEVLAYVGSAQYQAPDLQGYINGLKARRSTGSLLKPFIYGLALEQGLITPDTLLKDTPLRVGHYQPENFEGAFLGPLSASDALVRSRNIPAIALLQQLRPGLYPLLQRADADLRQSEAGYGLTLAVGGAEMSMEQLLALYGSLANGGLYRPSRWFSAAGQPEGRRLLTPEASYLIRRMLETNPAPQRAFGARGFNQEAPTAWKTGTSSGLRDAWAIGLRGDFLVGVWLGNFDGSANALLVGRELAGPLLFNVLDALGPAPATESPPPAGLKQIDICPLSGAPRSPWCPHGKRGWIIPGVSPLATCAIHRRFLVDPSTGLRLCRGDSGPAEAKVAEFWDSDLLEQYRLAGIRRDPPPPYAHPCDDLAGGDLGAHPPTIVSPQPGVDYPVRPDADNRVQFSAVSAGGRHRLFWFLDDTLIGEGQSLSWPATPGRHLVRVVDEQGQSAATALVAKAMD